MDVAMSCLVWITVRAVEEGFRCFPVRGKAPVPFLYLLFCLSLGGKDTDLAQTLPIVYCSALLTQLLHTVKLAQKYYFVLHSVDIVNVIIFWGTYDDCTTWQLLLQMCMLLCIRLSMILGDNYTELTFVFLSTQASNK